MTDNPTNPDQHEAQPANAEPDDRRRLATQRDQLASTSKRPDGDGLESIDHPAFFVGGGALAVFGLRHWDSVVGLALAGIGGGLVYRGLKQNQMLDGGLKRRLLNTMTSQSTAVKTSITIDRPIDRVWDAWNDLANLSRCMDHINQVGRIDDGRWHWEARLPNTNMTVQWDADIVEKIDHELLVWRSTQGSDVNNEGIIEFDRLDDDQGTQIHAHIIYFPPAGKVGKAVAGFLGQLSEQVVKEDLRRFKQWVETGEVSTTAGQTSGRRQPPGQSGQNSPRPRA